MRIKYKTKEAAIEGNRVRARERSKRKYWEDRKAGLCADCHQPCETPRCEGCRFKRKMAFSRPRRLQEAS